MSEIIQDQERFFTRHKLWWWFVYTTMAVGAFGLVTQARIWWLGYDWAFKLIP